MLPPSVKSILKYAAFKLFIVYRVSTSLLASVLAFALADCRNRTRKLSCKEPLLLRSKLIVVTLSGIRAQEVGFEGEHGEHMSHHPLNVSLNSFFPSWEIVA
jgi:hypothetical protein